MDKLYNNSVDLTDEDLIREKFSTLEIDETPIWHGSPTFFSYTPRYFIAAIIFIVHFIFYRVAVTVYAEGKEGFFYTFFRIIDQLFDFIDVFAFVIVMLIIARINHFLNFSSSNLRTTFFLIFIGLIPAIWYIINVIDWVLLLLGRDNLNVPEWFDSWFLGLGVANTIIFCIYTAISQVSYSYLITDKNIYIRRKILFFYNSIKVYSLDELINIKTQISFLGKIIGYGNVLMITEGESQSKVNIEKVGLKKSYNIIKSIISYKRVNKNQILPPSECLFGIRKPMVVYKLANDLIDESEPKMEI